MKYFSKTFGCQMNFADSDEMGRHLKARGFESTVDENAADAVLVNTCTVRDLAEHKASSYIGRLADWKEFKKDGLIIVTGCAAERAKDIFKKRFPHVDLIVGAKDIERFPDELDALLQIRGIDEEDLPGVLEIAETEVKRHPGESRDPGFQLNSKIQVQSLDPGFRRGDVPGSPGAIISYVTIMRGCNYNCTYCIVPSVRGREVYLPIEEITKNVQDRVAEGAKEIWLLGQTVNSYKPAAAPRPDYDFSDLLRDVNTIAGVERVRFMSPHPYYLTEKLINAMAECDNVCEHIHLPVQSGSTDVLKRMKRNYTRESYLRNIEFLRKKIPTMAITTDLIVGFPGETDDDFNQTLSLVQEANFDSAYCFKYSPRPGTVSATFEDDVPMSVKEERVNILLKETDAQGVANAQKMVGTTQEVLIEEDKGNGLFRGKTRTAWKVRFHKSDVQVGQIVQAKIVGSHSRELHGETNIL